VLPRISTLVTAVVSFPINIFIGIVTAVVVIVPRTYALVVGTGVGTDMAVVVRDDAKSLVLADGVGEGALPVVVFAGTAVKTVISARAFRPRMVGIDGIAAAALAAVAGGLAGRGGIVPGVFLVMELWHGGPVGIVGETSDEEAADGFSSIRVTVKRDDGGIGKVGMGVGAYLCGSEPFADCIDRPTIHELVMIQFLLSVLQRTSLSGEVTEAADVG
jgi:hypothetical protein